MRFSIMLVRLMAIWGAVLLLVFGDGSLLAFFVVGALCAFGALYGGPWDE
jgi:hypothetical protein